MDDVAESMNNGSERFKGILCSWETSKTLGVSD